MKINEYIKYDAIGLSELIQKKEIKPEEPLKAAIELGKQLNPKLNVINQWFESIAWQLLESTTRHPLKSEFERPLFGIPCLLKDLGFSMNGTVDSFGSELFTTFISDHNNDYVDALLKAGLLPFGKTNAPEFGLSYDTQSKLWGKTINPLNESFMVGGSSGGSAAAVASGIVPIATANDGGGSIRVPASCCGLFGFKPSVGLTPDGPDFAERWSGFATAHVLTRSVRDSALMLDLVSTNKAKGHYYHASQQYPSALKVAVITETSVAVDAQLLQATELMEKQMAMHGHHCESVTATLNYEAIGEQVINIIAANTAAMLSGFEQNFIKQLVHPFANEFYQMGLKLSAVELINAKNKLYQLLQPVRDIFSQYDIIMTPALAQLPLNAGSLFAIDNFDKYLEVNNQFSPFTALFNQTGMPAMVVPMKDCVNNIPLSIQFAAVWGADEILFKLANQLLNEQ